MSFSFFFFSSGEQTFSICPFHLASVLESQTSAWLTVLHSSKGQRTVAFLTEPFGRDRDTFVWRGLPVIFCIVLRTIIFYSTGPRPLWTTAAHAQWIVGSWEHGGRASRQVWSNPSPHPPTRTATLHHPPIPGTFLVHLRQNSLRARPKTCSALFTNCICKEQDCCWWHKTGSWLIKSSS